MPRPALTRSRIVTAGVAIVGEIGLSGLSFGAVARRVNSTATGVQRLIGSTELLHAVVEEVVVSMPTVPAKGDWRRRLQAWGVETRAWLVGYPGLARHLLRHRWSIPAGLDRIEQIVDVLMAAGLTPAHCAMTGRVLYCFVIEGSDLDDPTRVLGGESLDDAQFRFGLDLLLEGIAHRLQDVATRPSGGAPASLTR
jgi:AcrR family transcriptional regulator